MGEAGTGISLGQLLYVPTGGAVPEGADAVVMVEYTESIGEDILVKKPVALGKNMVGRGEDFSAGRGCPAGGRSSLPVLLRPLLLPARPRYR